MKSFITCKLQINFLIRRATTRNFGKQGQIWIDNALKSSEARQKLKMNTKYYIWNKSKACSIIYRNLILSKLVLKPYNNSLINCFNNYCSDILYAKNTKILLLLSQMVDYVSHILYMKKQNNALRVYWFKTYWCCDFQKWIH